MDKETRRPDWHGTPKIKVRSRPSKELEGKVAKVCKRVTDAGAPCRTERKSDCDDGVDVCGLQTGLNGAVGS